MDKFNMTKELTDLLVKMEERMDTIEERMIECDKERAILAQEVQMLKQQQTVDLGTINRLITEIETLKKAA